MLSKKMCLFYDSMIIGKATFIPSIILRSLIFNELTTNHDSIKVVFAKEICIETKGYLPSRAKTDINILYISVHYNLIKHKYTNLFCFSIYYFIFPIINTSET